MDISFIDPSTKAAFGTPEITKTVDESSGSEKTVATFTHEDGK
jgi:hypothetical protein